MEKQIIEYAGGNEIAAIAIKQIGYDLKIGRAHV